MVEWTSSCIYVMPKSENAIIILHQSSQQIDLCKSLDMLLSSQSCGYCFMLWFIFHHGQVVCSSQVKKSDSSLQKTTLSSTTPLILLRSLLDLLLQLSAFTMLLIYLSGCMSFLALPTHEIVPLMLKFTIMGAILDSWLLQWLSTRCGMLWSYSWC